MPRTKSEKESQKKHESESEESCEEEVQSEHEVDKESKKKKKKSSDDSSRRKHKIQSVSSDEEEKEEEEDEEDSIDVNPYKCCLKNCTYRGPSRNVMYRHYTKIHAKSTDRRVKCPFCPAGSPDLSRLYIIKHVRKQHPSEKITQEIEDLGKHLTYQDFEYLPRSAKELSKEEKIAAKVVRQKQIARRGKKNILSVEAMKMKKEHVQDLNHIDLSLSNIAQKLDIVADLLKKSIETCSKEDVKSKKEKKRKRESDDEDEAEDEEEEIEQKVKKEKKKRRLSSSDEEDEEENDRKHKKEKRRSK